MLSADDMPDDNAELASVDVSFPTLDDDWARSCPVPMAEVLRYVADEVPGGDTLTEADLTFRRTALVEGTKYWIWSFTEPYAEPAFVTVSAAPGGATTVGYDANYYGLSPEQFILGDYHQVF